MIPSAAPSTSNYARDTIRRISKRCKWSTRSVWCKLRPVLVEQAILLPVGFLVVCC